jgi:RNA polymerase sigma factor (sigma-70 family)
MTIRSIEALQRYLRGLRDKAVPLEDAVLLNRFVAANDHEAFELMVARHGPMVLGTARRLVDDSHDAEDVFQSVFLSLARLAKTIRHGRTLPAWLYKTTCRIAAKVHKDRVSGSQEPHPEPCENATPEVQLVWQEIRQALDEELQRLPERLRSPLLLCYLSGLTRDEVAKQLGWSLGTLKRRLEEGRETLRFQLTRRGFASVGLALVFLTPETLRATVSKSLLESTLSMIFSSGTGVPAMISDLVLNSVATTNGFAMKSIPAMLAATAIAVGPGFYVGMRQADQPRHSDEQTTSGSPILPALDESKPSQKPDTNPANPEKPLRLKIGHMDQPRIERKVDPIALPLDKPNVWTLNFRYKAPRIATLDTLDKNGKPVKKIVWYMWYQVYNLTDEPRVIRPEFELVTKDLNTSHLDQPETNLVDQIRKIEDPTGIFNIETSSSISNRPIAISLKDAIPRLFTGVAIWTDLNEKAQKTNKFSIYITGLSDGEVIEQKKNAPDKITKRKTLQINFLRPTDDKSLQAGDILPDDLNTAAEQWIYRTVSAVKPKK